MSASTTLSIRAQCTTASQADSRDRQGVDRNQGKKAKTLTGSLGKEPADGLDILFSCFIKIHFPEKDFKTAVQIQISKR